MELVYVWIEDYKNIKKQGFNFSPNHKFELEKKADGNYELKDNFDNKELKLLNNFFGNQISNVSAIIGKNGSGKSSLLEVLHKILKSGRDVDLFSPVNVKSILVLFFDETTKNYSFFSIGDRFCDSTVFFNGNEISKNYFEELNYIYYDEVFTKKPKDIKRRRKNILENNMNEENLKGNDISLQKLLLKNKNNIFHFAANETKNTLLFLSQYKAYKILEDGIGIKFPQELFIKLKDESSNNLEEFNKKLKNKIKDIILEKLMKRINEKNIEVVPEKIGIMIITFLEKYKSKKFVGINTQDLWEIYQDREVSELFFNEMILFFSNYGKDYLNFYKSFYEEIYLNTVEKSKSENINDFIFNNQKIEINLKRKNKIYREKIITFFSNNFLEEMVLDYNFDIEMSSGEKSFCSLFSRLYSIKDNFKGQKSIIILMDEPETFMHPEWQRNFLDIFLKFIQELFTNKNIQVILTSHSPFVASDLPRNNVIMLDIKEMTEKDENGKVIKNQYCRVEKNKINTFGANIFDLYKEGFFVDSTFGEFSREKIKEVIELLSKQKNDKNEEVYFLDNKDYMIKKYGKIEKYEEIKNKKLKEIEYIIYSIGEELIKVKLNKMYKNYLSFKEKKLDKGKKTTIREVIKNSGFTETEFKKYLKGEII